MRRLLSPKWLALAGVTLLAVAALVAYVVPSGDTYIVLPDRAKPVEPTLNVEGAKPDDDGGGIYFVDVVIRRASLLEEALPSINDDAELVPANQFNPTGVTDRQRRLSSRLEMTTSQRIASVVALRHLGYKPRVDVGLSVASVLPDRPAQGKLEVGDVILAVNGRTVKDPRELRRQIAAGGGAPVRFRIRRDGRPRTVTIRPVRDPEAGLVVGIEVGQSVDPHLPIDIEINTGDVGGPSAGLAFALALLEDLGRDVDHGRKVAVTGALALDGTVLPVGGIHQKVVGARRTGAQLFVVPAGDNAREARRYADGMRVLPVKSFRQALRELATPQA